MSDPLRTLQVNNTPLQIDGQDETLREFTLGGPDCGRDVRLFLDRKVLEHLLEVSKSSNTGRVVLYGAGIKMKVRRSKSGHLYETMHLTSRYPVPENLSSEIDFNKSKSDQVAMQEMYKWK
jgi:hypothetical protein